MNQNGVREELENKLEQVRLRLVAVIENTAMLRTLRHSRDELRTTIQAAIDRIGNSATAMHQEVNLACQPRLPAEE
jgi:hypothetical protein